LYHKQNNYKMKTLIIHPKDSSTDFLKGIYFNIPNKTIVTGGKTQEEVHNLIKTHDRVIMLGHGTPHGLMSVGRFKTKGFIIDHNSVKYLREKKHNIYIWCNADQFVNLHQLNGFYSGMFVSEVGEAFYCNLPFVKQEQVDDSNYGFCHILSKYVNYDTQHIYNNVTEEYGVMDRNPVVKYNQQRLYQRV
jgi:hypothetical protein